MQALNRTTAALPLQQPERIVQFGGGNFLRAFVDWMVDILNKKADFNSTVVVVKPTARGSYEALDKQEGLFHTRLFEMDDGELKTSTRLISCVSRSLNPYESFESFLDLAKQDELQFVVSNTTESGIAFEPSDGFADAPPSSFPAKLCRFLFERFEHFSGDASKGLVILPCELIEDNGLELKHVVLQYAQLWHLSNDFIAWLEESNSFCNTLVDRIVTGLPKVGLSELWHEIGFEDQLFVTAEAYHSWIIDGPDWLKEVFPIAKTDLNVVFTNDLSAQRNIKVRILNGAHTSLVPVAFLFGKRTVDTAISNPILYDYLKTLIYEEILPTLKEPKEELESFAAATLKRFSNPTLNHQLSAIALNSTSKFKTRLLPTLLDYYGKTGELPKRIVFAFACLIRFYKGDWQGEKTPVQDDTATLAWWAELWTEYDSMSSLSEAVLANTVLWGQDLREIKGLASLLTRNLEALEKLPFEQILVSLSAS